MMMAPVASSLNVSGSRMAIPAIGPIPGSTPTAVPMIEPSSANSRFCGCSATRKPAARLPKASMGDALFLQQLTERLADHFLVGLDLDGVIQGFLAAAVADQLAH